MGAPPEDVGESKTYPVDPTTQLQLTGKVVLRA